MFGARRAPKGWNMSLKRYRESGAELPPDSAELQELETLYIFGLRATTCRRSGICCRRKACASTRKRSSCRSPGTSAAEEPQADRLKEGLKYKHSDCRPVLPNPDDTDSPPVVEVDLHSRLQAVASSNVAGGVDTQRPPVKLDPRHVALFDRTRIGMP